MGSCANQKLLRSALERDDREMSPLGEELNRQVEPSSGLTSDEGPWGSARGSPRPSTAHASLDCSQAPMLVERSEAELNSPTPAPPSKSLRKELLAPVGNEVPGCLSRVTKKPLKEAPNRRRRGLRAIDRESHQSPGEMIDDRRCPPTEWPDLRQGEGEPGDPEAERRGNGG